MRAFIKRRETVCIIFIAIVITALFFYKSVLHQEIPFPGDLLVNENPYQTQSFLGYAPGGYPNMAQGRDVIAELYPWKYFTIHELKQGHIPFWNPYNFSGNVHMQNYQSAVFSPFNIFFFLFSFTTAWSVAIMFQPLLAILFMYLFLRSLKLTSVASLAGGIAFGFSSYMTVWIEYGNIDATLLWLPLVLFSLHTFIEKRRIIYFLLTVIALSLSFFGGYIQGTFYLYIIAFLYALYQCLPKRKTLSIAMWVALALAFFLPIGMTAFQLLPTSNILHLSARVPYTPKQIEALLQPFYYWVTIFVPDFFGNPAHRNYFLPNTYIERVMFFGTPLIFFCLFSLTKVKDREMKFFFFVAIVFLIVTTNIPLVRYIYLLPIPTLSTTVPTRALSIFIASMIIVGSFGVDYWYKQKKFEKTLMPFIFLGIYGLIWLSVFLFPQIFPEVVSHKAITIHNLFLPTVIAIVTIVFFYGKYSKLLRNFSIIAIFCILIADLFFFFQKITPFSPASLVYPQTPVVSYVQKNAGINRFWGYGTAYIPPNMQLYDGIYSPEGYDPLYVQTYGLLLKSSVNGKYPASIPRPDANIVPGYGSEDIKNPTRQKILNLLGVKYVLAQWSSFSPDQYQLVWQHSPWQVYKNRYALPRFFLTSRYIYDNNAKDSLAKLYAMDITKTVLLESNPKNRLDGNATGTVSLGTYTPDTIVFTTNTTGNMLLFLSDTYYPEWKGTIDGTIVPVHKADFTFRALEVPKGKHTVTFFYDAQDFYIGLKIAVASVIICILYSVYFYQYVEKK